MTEDVLSVDILYKDKDGKRMYPKTMYVRRSVAMCGRSHVVPKTGVRLRIVPIEKLSEEKNNA